MKDDHFRDAMQKNKYEAFTRLRARGIARIAYKQLRSFFNTWNDPYLNIKIFDWDGCIDVDGHKFQPYELDEET